MSDNKNGMKFLKKGLPAFLNMLMYPMELKLEMHFVCLNCFEWVHPEMNGITVRIRTYLKRC